MRYKYFTNGKNKCVVISSFAGEPIRCEAKCNPMDEFSIEKGYALAKARVDAEVAKRRMRRATQKRNEAYINAREALNRQSKMNRYYNDAEIAESKAITELNRILNDM